MIHSMHPHVSFMHSVWQVLAILAMVVCSLEGCSWHMGIDLHVRINRSMIVPFFVNIMLINIESILVKILMNSFFLFLFSKFPPLPIQILIPSLPSTHEKPSQSIRLDWIKLHWIGLNCIGLVDWMYTPNYKFNVYPIGGSLKFIRK